MKKKKIEPLAPLPVNIDEYIEGCASNARKHLKSIRRVVRKAAPEATECISYRMPCFKQDGVLIYFAAFKEHIGVFPPIKGSEKLRKATVKYAGPKGNLRFPLDQPIPLDLIEAIVLHRLGESKAAVRRRSATNKKKSTSSKRSASGASAKSLERKPK